MIKHLLATTAIVAIATSGAFAAEAAKPVANDKMAAAPQTQFMPEATQGDVLASDLIGQTVYAAATVRTDAMAPAKTDAMKPKADATMAANDKAKMDATQKAANDKMATDKNMQANNAPVNTGDMQSIGDINDLVVAEDGTLDAVVIGVGGFLGMGEKNVAVSFDQLAWTTDANGERYVTLAATKELLQNAPDFDVSVLKPDAHQNQAANNGKPAAPANQMAATPADKNQQMAANPADTKAPAAGAATTANDNAKMATVDATKISADTLIGTTVYDSDNQNVGEVGDVIANKDGTIDAVIVDVGGFLGIGEKPVAIAFEDLDIRKDENNNMNVYSAFTKEQLDGAPQYDKDAYEQQRDQMRLHTSG